MHNHRIAVVGGVAAGPAAAAEAKRVDPDAEVVLIEQGPVISYGACELPYYIGGEIPDLDTLILLTPEQFEESRGAHVLVNHSVHRIDPSANRVELEDRIEGRRWEERFDKIILATGATARRLNVEGETSRNVFVLRELTDARAIKKGLDMRTVQHAVVVGGGYVGVEAAEALTGLGIRVTILDRNGKALHKYVGPDFRKHIDAELQRNGVSVRADTVTRLTADGDGYVDSVWTESGERIGCQLVVVAIGIEPNTCLGDDAGLRIGKTGAIKTDDGMKTSAHNVWACGDCIEVTRIVDGKSILSPLSPTAFRTARVAAKNAARQGRGPRATFPGVTPASAVKVFDLEVAAVGLRLDEAIEAGFDAFSNTITGWSRVKMYPGSKPLHVTMTIEQGTGRLLGAELLGHEGAVHRADALVVPVRQSCTVSELKDIDLIYSPPFAPSLDPIIIAARQAEKKVKR